MSFLISTTEQFAAHSLEWLTHAVCEPHSALYRKMFGGWWARRDALLWAPNYVIYSPMTTDGWPSELAYDWRQRW